MRTVKKPWGNEMIWAETSRYVGKIIHIDEGQSLSLQYHQEKDETIMLLSGRMRFECYQEGEAPRFVELAPFQPVHIRPFTRHRMTAIEPSDVVEVSTTELNDVVRLEDKYGREGTNRP